MCLYGVCVSFSELLLFRVRSGSGRYNSSATRLCKLASDDYRAKSIVYVDRLCRPLCRRGAGDVQAEAEVIQKNSAFGAQDDIPSSHLLEVTRLEMTRGNWRRLDMYAMCGMYVKEEIQKKIKKIVIIMKIERISIDVVPSKPPLPPYPYMYPCSVLYINVPSTLR